MRSKSGAFSTFCQKTTIPSSSSSKRWGGPSGTQGPLHACKASQWKLCPSVSQIEYLLRKLMEAGGGEGCGWSEEKLRLSLKANGLTVWELIDLLGTGYFSRGLSPRTLSMSINEVFQELILDVLKQVGRDLNQTRNLNTSLHQEIWSEQVLLKFCQNTKLKLCIKLCLSNGHF